MGLSSSGNTAGVVALHRLQPAHINALAGRVFLARQKPAARKPRDCHGEVTGDEHYAAFFSGVRRRGIGAPLVLPNTGPPGRPKATGLALGPRFLFSGVGAVSAPMT